MSQLIAENLSFVWPDGKGFTDVNFHIKQGDFVLIHGPSGMGKSTLLRLIVRLEELQKGRIIFNDNDITTMQPNIVRQKIALVTQTPQLENTTLEETLRAPFRFVSNAERKEPTKTDLEEHLKALGLDLPLTTNTHTLSLGQQQRVAFVRHILLEPEMLLLDEPTSALDAESRKAVEQCIETLNESGMTMLMVTHTDYRPKRPHTIWNVEQGVLHQNM